VGLRSAILDAVSSAITAVGDIAETVTYTARTKGDYDTYSGQLTVTDIDYTLKAIIGFDDNTIAGKASNTEIDSKHTGEISALFSAKGISFTPKTDDLITRDSEVYTITDIKKDPVEASYTLKLRRAG